MNAKDLAEAIEIVERTSVECDLDGKKFWSKQMDRLRSLLEGMSPRYRPPQPSDDGRYCFLEELPSDAPPTLVSLRKIAVKDDSGLRRVLVDQWQFWTLAGWRELTGNIWPCERPEATT